MEFSKDAVEKIRGNTAKIATIRIDKDKAAFIKESGCGITLKLKLGKYHNKVLLYRNELVQTLLGDQL